MAYHVKYDEEENEVQAFLLPKRGKVKMNILCEMTKSGSKTTKDLANHSESSNIHKMVKYEKFNSIANKCKEKKALKRVTTQPKRGEIKKAIFKTTFKKMVSLFHR